MGATPAGEMLPSHAGQGARALPQHHPDRSPSASARVPLRGAQLRRDDAPHRAAAGAEGHARQSRPVRSRILQPLRDQTHESALRRCTRTGRARPSSSTSTRWSPRSSRCATSTRACSTTLDSIADNTADSQMVAAIALIQMNVSPVIAVHVPFGGDNHRDIALADRDRGDGVRGADHREPDAALQTAGLQDKVSFMTLTCSGAPSVPATPTAGSTT